MFENLKEVNYNDIVKNEPLIINYLAKYSDSFSMIPIIKRPYSQIPPVFNYVEQLRPFVIDYLFDREKWPVDFFGRDKHQIMVICKCCKESRAVLVNMPNVFHPSENNLPEDICFFRNGKLWFATVSHEQIAFTVDMTKQDINFFEQNGIKPKFGASF